MNGDFNGFGGRFVPETLFGPLDDLEALFRARRDDPGFRRELDRMLQQFAGRPTQLTPADRLSEAAGGARIFLKREDLAHTGAHKINNAVGQALLARSAGKRRVVAETGAGQHGVASAAACAALGLDCVVYMGERDAERQAPNVARIKLLGAELRLVRSGNRTLKDAVNEAIRDWVGDPLRTHYLMGSAVGPHPYPTIVREFQSVIGRECRAQVIEALGRNPDAVVACVGGGSNAIGIFSAFLDDPVHLVGVQAGGRGLDTGLHAAPLLAGRPGVLHGSRSFVLQDVNGQILETHSIAAGLDYSAVGPEHSALKLSGRVEYVAVTDTEALRAFRKLSRTEGIIPALESSHAVAWGVELAKRLGPGRA